MSLNYLIHLLLLELRFGGGLQVASVPQNHTQRDQQLPSKCARNLHMSLHRRTRIAAYLPSFRAQLHLCALRQVVLPSFRFSPLQRCSDVRLQVFLSLFLALQSVPHSTASPSLGEFDFEGSERGKYGKRVFSPRETVVRGARAVGVTNGGGRHSSCSAARGLSIDGSPSVRLSA